MKKIPVCVPPIPANAASYVNEVINANWISGHCADPQYDYISKLEKKFAEIHNCKFAVAANSGTDALRLSLVALQLPVNSQIIIPDFTMIAVAAAVVQAGAEPVFVDASASDWCIDAELIEAALTERTGAIIAAHSYGQSPDLSPIRSLAQKYGLALVEDAAQGLGARYHGQPSGSIGDMGCFSFFGNKMVTCGEGGIIVTSQPALAKRLNKLKNHMFGEPRFVHQELGYSSRLSNLSAAYAFASLQEFDQNLQRKRELALSYSERLKDVSGITLPQVLQRREHAYWMFGITIDSRQSACQRDQLTRHLWRDFGIETRHFFYPMHLQPALAKYALSYQDYPVSRRLSNEGLYLPSSVTLSQPDIDYICNAVKSLVNG